MFQVNARCSQGFSDLFTISILLAIAVRCAGFAAIGGMVDRRFLGKRKVRFYFRRRRQARRFAREVNKRLATEVRAAVVKRSV